MPLPIWLMIGKQGLKMALTTFQTTKNVKINIICFPCLPPHPPHENSSDGLEAGGGYLWFSWQGVYGLGLSAYHSNSIKEIASRNGNRRPLNSVILGGLGLGYRFLPRENQLLSLRIKVDNNEKSFLMLILNLKLNTKFAILYISKRKYKVKCLLFPSTLMSKGVAQVSCSIVLLCLPKGFRLPSQRSRFTIFQPLYVFQHGL